MAKDTEKLIRQLSLISYLMAERRPVTAPEISTDGFTGFLCDSTEEMIEAVDRVATLSPQVCREHAAERFSADAMVGGYEAVYRAVGWGQKSPATGAAMTAARELRSTSR